MWSGSNCGMYWHILHIPNAKLKKCSYTQAKIMKDYCQTTGPLQKVENVPENVSKCKKNS